MYATLSWVLIASLPLLSLPTTHDDADPTARRMTAAAPGRVAVWSDREDPYERGQGARVYLSADRASHVAVFRVDTDGRVSVLFPREPWGDTYVREPRRFEVTGGRGGRSFVVDDYPGVGYLFAIASTRCAPLRGYRSRRLLGLPRHRGRPDPGRPVRRPLRSRRAPRAGRRVRLRRESLLRRAPLRLSEVRLLRLSRVREVRRMGSVPAGLRTIPDGDLRRPPLLSLSVGAGAEHRHIPAAAPRSPLRLPRQRLPQRVRDAAPRQRVTRPAAGRAPEPDQR